MARNRPTSADVARLAGVSRTTVSFVLNDRPGVQISAGTRRRVREAAARLDYHPSAPARQLAGGAAQALGLVLRQSVEHVAVDALLPETLRGLAAAARSVGYRVLVEPMPPSNGDFLALVRSQHASGLVVSGPRSDDRSLAALVGDGFPIVIQGSLPGLDAPSIDVDNVAGARTAVEHLLLLGHRRIACITNAPLAYTAAIDRLAGYRHALADAGLDLDPGLVAEGDFDASSGHRAVSAILASAPDVTAVFAAGDVVAFGVLSALRDAGRRVPDDVSVIGFDDIPLAAYSDPPLTTVRVPAHDLGFAAGRTLLDRIAGRALPPRTLLPVELVIRGSVARPPARRRRARARPTAQSPP